MKILKKSIFLLCSIVAYTYSQTNIPGRFVGVNARALESAQVILKDGTGDSTYSRFQVSRNGLFCISTSLNGALWAEFSCPGYNSLGVALLIEKLTTDTVEVTLSPSSRPPVESRLVFRDSLSIIARFALLHKKSKDRLDRYGEEKLKFLLNGGTEKEFLVDWKNETQSVLEAMIFEKEPILRQELIMQYNELYNLQSRSASRDSLKKWIVEIPPTSLAWVYHQNLAFASHAYMWERRGFDYQNRIVAEHPSRIFRARMLYEFAHLYKYQKDDENLQLTISALVNNYSETGWALKARLLVAAKLRVGDAVPAFNLQSLEDSLTYFSNANLLGKVYLIDFWGTWCTPCIQEMPYLNRAYERLAKHGFTILSISSDKSRDVVVNYRKGKWSMPWLNAFIGSPGTHSMESSFGVSGWPFPVLVDKKGTIVALGYDDLHGEKMVRTIEKYVQKK